MLLKDSYVLYLERRILTPSGTSFPPTKLSNKSSASSSLYKEMLKSIEERGGVGIKFSLLIHYTTTCSDYIRLPVLN